MACFLSGNAKTVLMFLSSLEITGRFGAIPVLCCTFIHRTSQVLLVDMSVIMVSKNFLFEKLLFRLTVPFRSSLPPFYQ